MLVGLGDGRMARFTLALIADAGAAAFTVNLGATLMADVGAEVGSSSALADTLSAVGATSAPTSSAPMSAPTEHDASSIATTMLLAPFALRERLTNPVLTMKRFDARLIWVTERC